LAEADAPQQKTAMRREEWRGLAASTRRGCGGGDEWPFHAEQGSVWRRATESARPVALALTLTSTTFSELARNTSILCHPHRQTHLPGTPHTPSRQHGLRQQDADYAPGADRGCHAERPHARRGTARPNRSCAWPAATRPLTVPPETQRALLRALRPQARHISVQGRGGMLHGLHGEVHGRMEHRLQAVRCADTARGPERRADVDVG
jgi:hypothetical protein